MCKKKYSRNDRPKLMLPKNDPKKWRSKWQTKLTRQKKTDKTEVTKINDTQNDRQSWNDKQITTGTAKTWQIANFAFFNLCLHKFLLTLRMSNLSEMDVGPFTKTRLKYGWGCTPWLAGCIPVVAHCQHPRRCRVHGKCGSRAGQESFGKCWWIKFIDIR